MGGKIDAAIGKQPKQVCAEPGIGYTIGRGLHDVKRMLPVAATVGKGESCDGVGLLDGIDPDFAADPKARALQKKPQTEFKIIPAPDRSIPSSGIPDK